MQRVLRLSTNFLAGRRSRTLLIIAAVALSTALVAAVSCAMASLSAGMEWQVASTVGRADVRVREIADQFFDADVLDAVRNRPDIEVAAPRLRAAITLQNRDNLKQLTCAATGVDPALEDRVVVAPLRAGRPVQADDEVVLDAYTADQLEAKVGDSIRVLKTQDAMKVTVVGIAEQRAMQVVYKPGVTMTIATLEHAAGMSGKLSEIAIALKDPLAAEAVSDDLMSDVPDGVVVAPTERSTSNMSNTLRANNFAFLLASLLSYIAAAFIVLTGLTTNVLERQRELAIMRCVGAARGTLALAQLGVGVIIGSLGASIGLPLGVGLAYAMTRVFPDRLPAGLSVSTFGLVTAFLGAIGAGLFGAIWPAVSAARSTPLSAMAPRAIPATRRGVLILGTLGVLGIGIQLAIIGLSTDGQSMFWAYATLGLPAMFVGYFLIGVPLCLLAAWILGPIFSLLLGLPRNLLRRSLARTPFRNGFTAGALMVGLAMMVSIWTNGSALLRDWLSNIEFPDAFVHGWLGLTPDSQRAIERLSFVTETCAITMFKTDDSPFGVQGLRPVKTTFIAFEPDPFFRMTKLHWIDGDPEYAQRRLNEGGAVLVAREFTIARPGMTVGKTITITTNRKQHDFEIVGVVSSPGLDIVGKSTDIGKEQADLSIHCIFGSRGDLKRVFNNEAIHLIQVGVKPESKLNDRAIQAMIHTSLGGKPLLVGSGREMREGILMMGRSSMKVASAVAVAAMIIGCLGVVNIVVAGIDARRHEFGVLRAVGAGRGMLVRLLLGEVFIITTTAGVLGTLMGLQGSWAGIRLHRMLAGLELNLRPPPEPIALGWAMLFVLTLIFVTPIILRVAWRKPRELLGATRG